MTAWSRWVGGLPGCRLAGREAGGPARPCPLSPLSALRRACSASAQRVPEEIVWPAQPRFVHTAAGLSHKHRNAHKVWGGEQHTQSAARQDNMEQTLPWQPVKSAHLRTTFSEAGWSLAWMIVLHSGMASYCGQTSAVTDTLSIPLPCLILLSISLAAKCTLSFRPLRSCSFRFLIALSAVWVSKNSRKANPFCFPVSLSVTILWIADNLNDSC